MRFSADTKSFKAALDVCLKHVNPKSPLPILGHILIEASTQTVKLSASDMAIGCSITIDAEVSVPGSFTLPGAKLKALVAMCGNSLEICHETEGSARISTEGTTVNQWRLSGIHCEEYPTLPCPEGDTFKLPAAALGNAIEEVAVAAASSADEARSIFTGIQLAAIGGQLTLVATDGRRIAVSQREGSQGVLEPIVVPAAALVAFAKQLGSDGEVELRTSRSRAFFSKGRFEMFAPLLDGRFPDWTKVVPDRGEFPWEVRLEKKAFVHAIKSSMPMAKEPKSPGLLRFDLGSHRMKISSNTPDLGDAVVSLDADGQGDQLLPLVGFNGSYVLDGLMAIDDDEVLWQLQSESQSAVLRGASDARFRYVIMPVKLRDIELTPIEAARG